MNHFSVLRKEFAMLRSRLFMGRMRRYGLIAVLALTMVLTALPTAAMAAPASSWGHCNVHVVRKGQILSGIARYYGVTVAALADYNNINNPNQIYPGQHLCIPPAGTGHKPFPGHPPVGCAQYHFVRHGDTLSEIAKWYHVNLWALAKLNNIDNPNVIVKGSKLCIPSAWGGVSYGHDKWDGGWDGGYGDWDKPSHGCGSCGYYHKPDRGHTW
jgi:LysM repeat protein